MGLFRGALYKKWNKNGEILYKMTIISVSIPDDLKTFLDENPELSPSKMIQSKIMDIKDNDSKVQSALKKENVILLARASKLQKVIRNTGDWLEKKGLYAEFKTNVLEKEDIKE